ncbi:MAG: efflux RND transporter periplasmic adaptor subunit [Pseudomonadota bacterium]
MLAARQSFVPGVLLALAMLASTAAAQQPAAPPPAVGTITVATSTITPTERFVGRAEAIDRVELRARVTGFMAERHFVQGDMVEEGDLLFVIEKAPYEAILAQRQAELASAQAAVENAAAQLARGETLLEGNNIPKAEVDERRARLLIAQADVLEAKAGIQTAELDLGYTDVKAPVTGRIGRYTYSIGALVGPESDALATIVSEDPIYVGFPVSETALERARQSPQGLTDPSQIVVHVELPTGDLYDQPGNVAFGAVEVDQTTDTLLVRATVPNPDQVLTPGQFLNVVLQLGDPVDVLMVPAAATQLDQAGSYVLIVDENGLAQQRRVTLGQSQGADVVVTQGLAVGDEVIVNGIQKVRPGEPVAASPITDGPKA